MKMKKTVSLLLAVMMIIPAFTGCSDGVKTEKIKLDEVNFTIKAPVVLAASSQLTAEDKAELDMCAEAMLKAMETAAADAYTFDFSTLATSLKLDEGSCEEYLIAKLSERTESHMVTKEEMSSTGAWAVQTDEGYEDDIKCIWINVYENLDGENEFVIDVTRNSFALYTMRYIEKNGKLTETLNEIGANYDGTQPVDNAPLKAEESGLSADMYFAGRIYKTSIFEMPVLPSVDMTLSLSAKVVEGDVPGGFAGMLEGTVTIDGYTNTLTANGYGVEIPTGLVDDPSQYYLALAEVSSMNPQVSKSAYRNIFFVKKDMSGIVGLYEKLKSDTVNHWMELGRVKKTTFDAKVKENNEKLTALYAASTIKAYGSRKEYNNALAVLYNMMIGVDKSYLEKNMKPMIADVSKDIREYSEALKDETLARLGENKLYFFPDSRSMAIWLLGYDGTDAIVAIFFSTKQDDGYGGLYSAHYENGKWQLKVLKDTRIKT